MKKTAILSLLFVMILTTVTACNSIPAFQYPCCSGQEEFLFSHDCYFMAGVQISASCSFGSNKKTQEKTIKLAKKNVIFRMELHIPEGSALDEESNYFSVVWQDDYDTLLPNPPPVLLGMISKKTMQSGGGLAKIKSAVVDIFNRYYIETSVPKEVFAQGTHYFKIYKVRGKMPASGSAVYGEYTREGDSLSIKFYTKKEWLTDYSEDYYFNEEGEYFIINDNTQLH